MRKSEITRETFTGRRVCQYDPVLEDKCHERATVVMTIASYPTGIDDPLLATSLFCAVHADMVVSYYEREWDRHPERFAD